jgi:hypothetical protein
MEPKEAAASEGARRTMDRDSTTNRYGEPNPDDEREVD